MKKCGSPTFVTRTAPLRDPRSTIPVNLARCIGCSQLSASSAKLRGPGCQRTTSVPLSPEQLHVLALRRSSYASPVPRMPVFKSYRPLWFRDSSTSASLRARQVSGIRLSVPSFRHRLLIRPCQFLCVKFEPAATITRVSHDSQVSIIGSDCDLLPISDCRPLTHSDRWGSRTFTRSLISGRV